MYANSPDHFYLSIIGLETGVGEPGPDRKQGERGEFNNNSWLLEQDEIVVLA